jgi:3'-5' exoribonuclease
MNNEILKQFDGACAKNRITVRPHNEETMAQNTGIEGIFTIMQWGHRISVNKQEYLRLLLENAYESITANCWLNKYSGPHTLCRDAIIHINGRRKKLDFREITDIYRATIVSPTGSDILTSIPGSSTTNQYDLKELIELASKVQIEPLRNFIYDAFLNRNFGLRFCTLPASHNFHHSKAGGLLRHSLECAEIVAQCPALEPTDKDLGIVAAIFHDAGKTLTMGIQRKTKVGRLVDHDALTLEALYKPLSQLDRTWPDGGIALRHIWTCRSQKHWGYKTKMPVADVVQMADRISANMETEKQLFSTAEPWKSHVKHAVSEQRFWRPSKLNMSVHNYETQYK